MKPHPAGRLIQRLPSAAGLGALWCAAGVLLAVLGGALERRTAFELYFDGGILHWSVAGSTAAATVGPITVEAIELHLMDSVEPPGGGFIELVSDAGESFHAPLPRRFDFPRGHLAPVGDWELDEFAAAATVFRRPLALAGPFTLRGSLRGRFLHAATITLAGSPTVHLQFRRGLINNDLFILDADGSTLAAASLDPTPVADFAATLATLLRGTAVGCGLIGLLTLLGAGSRRLLPPRLPPTLQWSVVALAAAASVLVSAWTASSVLEGLPHQPDGVAYLLQARWLSAGQLWLAETPAAEHFDPPFIHHRDGRLLGHYPVGWPALLAVAEAAGAPWVVNPLLRGLFTVLLFLLAREATASPAVALLATALAAVSPLATILFASHLAHGLAATAITAFLWLLLRATRVASPRDAAVAGVAIGVAFAVRPVSALAVAAAGALFLLAAPPRGDSSPRLRRQLAVALGWGGLLAALPAFLYNLEVTGHPLSFPYTLARGTMYAAAKLPFGLRNLDAIIATIPPSLFGWGWPALTGRLALAAPFAAIAAALLRRRPPPALVLLAGSWATIALIHLGARASGLHGYGPRYHFEAIAALMILAAVGLVRLAGNRKGELLSLPTLICSALVAAIVVPGAVQLPRRLALYAGYNQVDGCLHSQLEARSLDWALVLFSDRDWRNWAAAAHHLGPELDGDLIFATAGADPTLLLQLYGDRPLYRWHGQLLEGPLAWSDVSAMPP